MAEQTVSVVLHDEVADVVRREAARTGRTETEVVEAAVRRLAAPSVLEKLWARATLGEEEAMAIATEEIAAHRADRRAG